MHGKRILHILQFGVRNHTEYGVTDVAHVERTRELAIARNQAARAETGGGDGGFHRVFDRWSAHTA